MYQCPPSPHTGCQEGCVAPSQRGEVNHEPGELEIRREGGRGKKKRDKESGKRGEFKT